MKTRKSQQPPSETPSPDEQFLDAETVKDLEPTKDAEQVRGGLSTLPCNTQYTQNKYTTSDARVKELVAVIMDATARLRRLARD